LRRPWWAFNALAWWNRDRNGMVRWIAEQVRKRAPMSIVNWLKGRKTYIAAIAAFVLGGLAAIGYPAPEWVYVVLAALGLGALRAGLQKVAPPVDGGKRQ